MLGDMKLGILSDIHDHVWHLAVVLGFLREEAVEEVIFCGDLCSPFVVALLGEGFPGVVHLILGNNDGDGVRIAANAAKSGRIRMHNEYFEGEIGGRKVAANHYPAIARGLAQGGGFDLVCYGHDHHCRHEMVGGTLLANPGAVMGYDGVARQDLPATFMIYDAAAGRCHAYEIGRDSGAASGFAVYPHAA